MSPSDVQKLRTLECVICMKCKMGSCRWTDGGKSPLLEYKKQPPALAEKASEEKVFASRVSCALARRAAHVALHTYGSIRARQSIQKFVLGSIVSAKYISLYLSRLSLAYLLYTSRARINFFSK